MKVYIICPYNVTGGPKSLHQLGSNLVNKGLQVFMFYGEKGIPSGEKELLFKDCKANVTTKIEDSEKNILIVPEYDTNWFFKFRKINKVIWWLSLDYYLYNYPLKRAIGVTSTKGQNKATIPLRYIKYKFEYRHNKYISKNKDFQEAYHLYNCEYVRNYLRSKGVDKSKMSYLCGPIVLPEKAKKTISKDKILKKKKNVIAYNPAKANPKIIRLVKKYMSTHFDQYKFIAIKNMNHNDVLNILQSAKVYLDLGYFPGPERMPREAVSYYCNIITSNIGSAFNDKDVPIPDKYKFSLNKKNVPNICNLIIKMSDNYLNYLNEFDLYREKVIKQIEDFDDEINEFIKKLCN